MEYGEVTLSGRFDTIEFASDGWDFWDFWYDLAEAEVMTEDEAIFLWQQEASRNAERPLAAGVEWRGPNLKADDPNGHADYTGRHIRPATERTFAETWEAIGPVLP